MFYGFGDVIYEVDNPKCIQMMGKVVIASNIGRCIKKSPQFCQIGTLIEIENESDRPFLVKNKEGKLSSYTFIREVLKKD